MRLMAGNAGLRCDYCQCVVATKADDTGVQYLDETRGLKCPACAAELWDAVLARVEVKACKQCHGTLVALGAFEGLIEHMRALHQEREIPPPPDEAELGRKLQCPRCHQKMDTHIYLGGGNVVMSTCEQCELHWLDGGVLMQIVKAPQ